jgi:hypothetical protein
MDELQIGDRVIKPIGYPFPGVIVAKFTTTAGAPRYVVECTVPECAGMLHIYGPSNLEKCPNPASRARSPA